jgi:uncharacterized membrane protein
MCTLIQKTIWKLHLAAFLVLSCLQLGFPLVAFSQGGTFTTFDVPGARATLAYSINEEGVVAGSYLDAPGYYHGFVRLPDGTFTTFDLPGGTSTIATSINDEGAVTGNYDTAPSQNGFVHGFVRMRSGRIRTFDVPSAINGTYPQAITEEGAVAGWYGDASNEPHGFVRHNGTVTTFDPPDSVYTFPNSINEDGLVAGWYYSGGVPHGFVRLPQGTITTIDPPASVLGTQLYGINEEGAVVGLYVDASVSYHVFVQQPQGTTTTFDFSGAYYAFPMSINAHGAITGYSVDSTGPFGFVGDRQGTITRFNPPGSTYTVANSINKDGLVTGYFYDANNVIHGFLRTP